MIEKIRNEAVDGLFVNKRQSVFMKLVHAHPSLCDALIQAGGKSVEPYLPKTASDTPSPVARPQPRMAPPASARPAASPAVPLVRTPAPADKPVPLYQTCFEMAMSDQLELDRFTRCDLVFSGSRDLYQALYRKSSGTQKTDVDREASDWMKKINASVRFKKDWQVQAVPFDSLYDGTRCQFAAGARGGGKVRPLSFALADITRNEIRHKALVEPMS